MKTFTALLLAFTLARPCLAADDSSVGSPAWNRKMKELSELLPELLSDASVPEQKLDEDRRERLVKHTRRVAELAHDLQDLRKKAGAKALESWDPGLVFVSGLLEREAKRAADAIAGGHLGYGRRIALGLGRYCISCHTRDTSGPEFADAVMKSAGDLTRMEKAELAAAMRRFDLALKELEAIVADGAVLKDRPLEWDRAVKYALAIAVRFQESPENAARVVDKVLAQPALPAYLRTAAQGWKDSAGAWKKETRKGQEPEGRLVRRVRDLSKEARRKQRYPADHRADLLYLRLTAAAHELLTRFPKAKAAPEMMLLAGEAYETLEYPGVWLLNENYYEACVRTAPHTDIARRCFERYEQSVYVGYSGSGGTHIPPAARKTLDELRALAAPAKAG